MTEQLNPAIASAAVTSPWWLPPLGQLSDIAALVLPILGAAWLAVQIGVKLYEVARRNK